MILDSLIYSFVLSCLNCPSTCITQVSPHTVIWTSNNIVRKALADHHRSAYPCERLPCFLAYALIQSTNIASRITLSWYGFAFYIPRRCYRNLDNAENYRSTAYWLYNILTSEEFRNAERMPVRTGSQVFCVFPFFPFHRNSVTLTLTTEFFSYLRMFDSGLTCSSEAYRDTIYDPVPLPMCEAVLWETPEHGHEFPGRIW